MDAHRRAGKVEVLGDTILQTDYLRFSLRSISGGVERWT